MQEICDWKVVLSIGGHALAAICDKPEPIPAFDYKIFFGQAGYILAACIAAGGVVWTGFNSWKLQLAKVAAEENLAKFKAKRDVTMALWQRQHDVASQTLLAFHTAYEAINHVRHPLWTHGEVKDRKPYEWELEKDKNSIDAYQVIFVRLKSYSAAFDAVEGLRARYSATFGMDSIKPFTDLRLLLHRIRSTAGDLISTYPGRKNPEMLAQKHKMEQIIWKGLPENDPIDARLKEIFNEVEAVCRPFMKPPTSLD